MVSRFQILLGESVLTKVETELPRQTDGIIGLELLTLFLLALEDKFYEFVVLVEENIYRVFLFIFISGYILADSYFSLLILRVIFLRWVVLVSWPIIVLFYHSFEGRPS